MSGVADIVQVVSSVALTLLGGTASAVWFYSSRKREAAANASKAEAEAITKFAEEWKRLYEQRDERVTELNAKVDECFRDINELRGRLWELNEKYYAALAEKAESDFYRCVRRGCADRVPPHKIDEKGREA